MDAYQAALHWMITLASTKPTVLYPDPTARPGAARGYRHSLSSAERPEVAAAVFALRWEDVLGQLIARLHATPPPPPPEDDELS